MATPTIAPARIEIQAQLQAQTIPSGAALVAKAPDLARGDQDGLYRIEFSIADNLPFPNFVFWQGEVYEEVQLDITPRAIDAGRVASGTAGLLQNHRPEQHLGRIEQLNIGAGVLYAAAEFSQRPEPHGDPAGHQGWRDTGDVGFSPAH